MTHNGDGAGARYYGKYRGTVTDNRDPRRQGRVRARVPELLRDVDTGWALPCAPYAGEQSGAFTIPAEGAGVWIEFEAGEVSRPIWSGCWWPSDKVPTDRGGAAVEPESRILRSESGLMVALHDDEKTLAVSDENGRNLLLIEVQAGKVSLKATTKVVVDAPQIELRENGTHPAVFGDELTTYLTQLVTLFNSHVHPGQMAGPIPVTPAPPVAPFSAPTPSLLSTVVKLG